MQPPSYTVTSRDGFSAHVEGFDPSTASAAAFIPPRPILSDGDIGALAVCGEVVLEDESEPSHVLQVRLDLLLQAPLLSRRFSAPRSLGADL